MCLNVISKPQQFGVLAPGRALSSKEEKILIISANWQCRFINTILMAAYCAGRMVLRFRVVDTFVNFDQDRPYCFLDFVTHLPDCTVPWPQTSWYEVCTVKISRVFHFHRHLLDVLISVDFPFLCQKNKPSN